VLEKGSQLRTMQTPGEINHITPEVNGFTIQVVIDNVGDPSWIIHG